jgi:hypothetical protein
MLRRDFNGVLGSLAVGALAQRSYATGSDNPDRGPVLLILYGCGCCRNSGARGCI